MKRSTLIRIEEALRADRPWRPRQTRTVKFGPDGSAAIIGICPLAAIAEAFGVDWWKIDHHAIGCTPDGGVRFGWGFRSLLAWVKTQPELRGLPCHLVATKFDEHGVAALPQIIGWLTTLSTVEEDLDPALVLDAEKIPVG